MRRALLIVVSICLGIFTLAFVVLLPAMILGAPLALYGDPDTNEWTLWSILLRAGGVLVAMWTLLGLVAKFTQPRGAG
jgi:hypothetical protein